MNHNRRDVNQKEIVDALRGASYQVFITADIKNGFPDLLAVSKYGRACLLEVKMPGAKLTEDETKFFADCRMPHTIVRSGQEAVDYMRYIDEDDE